MPSKAKKTNKRKGASIEAVLLDSYNEYVKNNYPADPRVYVIRGHHRTIDALELYFRNKILIPPAKIEKVKKDGKKYTSLYGMLLVYDDTIEMGKLRFGPELIDLEWSEFYLGDG